MLLLEPPEIYAANSVIVYLHEFKNPVSDYSSVLQTRLIIISVLSPKLVGFDDCIYDFSFLLNNLSNKRIDYTVAIEDPLNLPTCHKAVQLSLFA
jgi:hypothetical protein